MERVITEINSSNCKSENVFEQNIVATLVRLHKTIFHDTKYKIYQLSLIPEHINDVNYKLNNTIQFKYKHKLLGCVGYKS